MRRLLQTPSQTITLDSYWCKRVRSFGLVVGVPLPVSVTGCGLVASLSITNKVPWLVPVAAGENETLTLQDCPGGMPFPQLLDCVKKLQIPVCEFQQLAEKPPMLNPVRPTFLSVIDCEDVFPTAVFGKL